MEEGAGKEQTPAVRPVTAENWVDFEAFFESSGKLRYCWCMAWRRMTPEERAEDTSAGRKAAMRVRILSGTPVGLLAYADGRAAAWCSVGPRESFHGLGGDAGLAQVWSITCFFVRPEFRGRGLTRALIRGAKEYAREHGARYLEAYPVLPDSPSYRHMGPKQTFDEEGFTFVKMQGMRRHVMVLPL